MFGVSMVTLFIVLFINALSNDTPAAGGYSPACCPS